ncbi:class I SAM-dependent methyltransferase [Candidatus Pacearchaeota archaeon]|nr:class I SAM-dependent methyltransferase [Candidatus Pacearchaeota archaeon]
MNNTEQFYNRIGKSLEGFTNETNKKIILREIMKYLNKNQKILDAGCGYGRITIPLAKNGFDVDGIDISSRLIGTANRLKINENLDIKFTKGDLRKLPYKEKYFDVVLCLWNTFMHFIDYNDQRQVLKEFKRILKKGGIIIIETLYIDKALEDYMKKHDELKDNYFFFRAGKYKTKLAIINKSNFIALGKELGFQDIKIKLKKNYPGEYLDRFLVIFKKV